MSEPEVHPQWAKYVSIILFGLVGIGALLWFFLSVADLYSQVSTNSDVIYFKKGVAYALGAGVGSSILAFLVVYQGLLGLPMTKKMDRRVTLGLVGSAIIVFVFPHIFHYFFDQFIVKKGYGVCEQASYQWLYYRDIAYTLTENLCAKLQK